MKKFSVVCRQDDRSEALSKQLIDALSKHLKYDQKNPELVIVIGGDGKLLSAAAMFMDKIESVKFVVLNTGRLGFSADYHAHEIEDLIAAIKSDNYKVETANLLDVTIFHNNGKKQNLLALNEFRIEDRNHTCDVDVYINTDFFENFRGNGICISTPFGSTAYNRSLGGAIIDPELNVLQVTEIAGLSNRMTHPLGNSLIIPSNNYVEIFQNPLSENKFIIGIDNYSENLDNFIKIRIKTSDKKIQFARYRDYRFYQRIQDAFMK
jgi:NAD+ kinase